MTPNQKALFQKTCAAVPLPDGGRAFLKGAISRGVADEYNAHLFAGWILRLGGNPMSRLLTRLAKNGVAPDTDITWDLIRRLERTDPKFRQCEGDFLAYMFGLPPRSARNMDSQDRIAEALRGMIHHEEGLIRAGVLRGPSMELQQAKAAMRR